MKNLNLPVLVMALVLFTGCGESVRSISHSAYPERPSYGGPRTGEGVTDPAFEYRGELSELDVLGIPRDEMTSEGDIRRALQNSGPVKLRPGSSVLLIQSGALFPDGAMVTELGKHYRVLPFSGVPSVHRTVAGIAQTESSDPEGYSRTLRLTAARGGAEFIICYWGMLESENDRLATKTVSWVPIVHQILPDEKQHMRIQIKMALVDVRSGNWSVFSSKPIDDARISTARRRGAVDQEQVERLKTLAYGASVTELVREFD